MMDTKEALKELEDLTVDYGNRNEEQIARLDEAIDMAMDALRNLPNRLRQATDTISRQSAIDAIVAQTIGYTVDEIKAECEENIFKENGYLGGLKDAINAIEDMPSAQPEKRTEKHTETHACDLISRQAAIDAFKPYADYESNRTNADWVRRIELVLNDMSSAQPEIIRCKECKHWLDIDDGRQKHRMCADIYGDWFCADAERKTDERSVP